MRQKARLKRSLSLPVVTLYGLGNILGAGIYVLVGKVAGEAGSGTTLAFLLAMIVAAFTAFSYMELAGRYPVSASISVYLFKAFKKKWLSVLVGLAMVAGGIASAAALAQGFAGYFSTFAPVSVPVASVGLLLVLGAIAIKGIGASAKTAVIFTVIEISGLLLVVWHGRHAIQTVDWSSVVEIDPVLGMGGLVAGVFLAFYAFIGFEDMVNVSEEAKDPHRTMPLAILISLVVSTVLYLLVVIVATTLIKPDELASSKAPLTLVFERSGTSGAFILSIIGMVATINGVIVQIIMGSRILYGLARRGWIGSSLAAVNKTSHTPVAATLVVLVLMISGTLLLPLVSLAQITSMLVLTIFTLVNIALVVIKRRNERHKGFIRVPALVPYIGSFLCAGTIGYQIYSWVG